MAFPRRSSRTPRSRFTLGLLLLTAVTLLVLDLPGTGPLDPIRSGLSAVFRPVRSAGEAVLRPVSNGWKGAFGYQDVKDENAELRKRLAEMKSEGARLDDLERELARLRTVEGIDVPEEKTVTAEVISEPLNSFDHTIEIDRGSKDRVRKGMVVITGGIGRTARGGQVLGRVVSTTPSSSIVELITEPSFSVGIQIADGTAIDRGTAQGRGRGKDLLGDGIEADTKVKKGDVVETSGLNRSAFPRGLQVGRVTKVNRGTTSDAKTIEIRPTADLDAVFVKVVLREAAG